MNAMGAGSTAASLPTPFVVSAWRVAELLSGEEASEAAAEVDGAEGWKSWGGCEPALGAPNGLGGTSATAAGG